MLKPLSDDDIKLFYDELILNPIAENQRGEKFQARKLKTLTNPFVCKDTFPPRRDTPTKRVMYGGYKGAATSKRRVCAICSTRPIVRFIVWLERLYDKPYGTLAIKIGWKHHAKGFCKNHLSEAWIEQRKHPADFGWDDPSR